MNVFSSCFSYFDESQNNDSSNIVRAFVKESHILR